MRVFNSVSIRYTIKYYPVHRTYSSKWRMSQYMYTSRNRQWRCRATGVSILRWNILNNLSIQYKSTEDTRKLIIKNGHLVEVSSVKLVVIYTLSFAKSQLFNKHSTTYIHNYILWSGLHPSFSQHWYCVCVTLIHVRRILEFKVDFEQLVFENLSREILFILRAIIIPFH